MLATSQEANKILKRLHEELKSLQIAENNSSTFICATVENEEDVRPEYDFVETQNRIVEINNKIMQIKHTLNRFNLETKLPGGITIDQALIQMPMLSMMKYRLEQMKDVPKKTRRSVTGNIIDYKIANYDPAEVQREYDQVVDALTEIQNDLNVINSTVQFEIPD